MQRRRLKLTNYTIALSEFSQRLGEAVQRLSARGVRIGGTRIARYQKIILKAVVDEERGKSDHQERPEFANAVVEASELIDISTLPDEVLSQEHVSSKLRWISKGPEAMAPEGSDPGRDYAFEFSTAARAEANSRLNGFHVSGDLVIAPSVALECKRISSVAQLNRRVKEARDQIADRHNQGESAGIIAVDVTRPLRVLHGLVDAAHAEALVEEAERQLTAFMAQHFLREVELERISTPAVLGVLVRYLAAGYAGERAQLRRSTVWQAVSLHAEDSHLNHDFYAASEFLGPEPMRLIEQAEVLRATENPTATRPSQPELR